MAGAIPIQNIYYLLCYAWDQLEEAEEVDIAAKDCQSLDELFARVLSNGTQHLLKRGLDRDYLACREETASLKGRFDLTASMTKQTWRQGRMVCGFDELSHDILHNRILKTTISCLADNPHLDKDTAALLHHQEKILSEITPIRITSRLFRKVRLHRNNRAYRFLLNICELIHDSHLPTEEQGESRFRDFIRDEKRMPYLFEAFVKNFYKREQQEFKVGAIQPKWNATGSEEALAVLPQMRTDVTLLSKERSIILDCKFYKQALKSRFENSKKLHSANLYQLYTYLKSSHHMPSWEHSEGILLYPAVTGDFDYQLLIDDHPIRATCIDLTQTWQEISAQLLSLLSSGSPATETES